MHSEHSARRVPSGEAPPEPVIPRNWVVGASTACLTRPCRPIRVIIMTTSKAEEDIFRTYDLSAASYITKPVTFEGLVEVIKALGKYWLEIVELPGEGNGG